MFCSVFVHVSIRKCDNPPRNTGVRPIIAKNKVNKVDRKNTPK